MLKFIISLIPYLFTINFRRTDFDSRYNQLNNKSKELVVKATLYNIMQNILK